MQTINTDIVIIGGGIAGLWTLNHLNNKGFNAILLENNALGSFQTIKSQGIIHGGLKYALNGFLSKETELISNMPNIWSNCLKGNGPVNLKDAKILSDYQYLWSSGSITTKLSSFFASKLLKSRIEKVQISNAPQIFQNNAFKGSLYKLNEIVLDMRSVISTLANNYFDKIIKIDQNQSLDKTSTTTTDTITNNNPSCNSVSFNDDITINKDEQDNIVNIIVNINKVPTLINAKCFVFCAGNNNYKLSKKHIATEMQLRPLHMTYFKGKNLEKLYAHCVGTSLVPKVTISTHFDQYQNTVWYIGGEMAETGLNRNQAEQIKHVKLKIAKLFPWIDFNDTKWGSFYVDRAEAKQNSGKKPENATCTKNKNAITAWPTKLALAPILAEKIETLILELNILPKKKNISINSNIAANNNDYNSFNDMNFNANENVNFSKFPKPKVCEYAWDELVDVD